MWIVTPWFPPLPPSFQCGHCERRTAGGGARTFGIARARYNFSARDRSELSLREGDTIRILSRKGQSGWWKGEVYGKVSENKKKNNKNLKRPQAFKHSQLSLTRWASSLPTTWTRNTRTTADLQPVLCSDKLMHVVSSCE